jgi:hypothetical protein
MLADFIKTKYLFPFLFLKVLGEKSVHDSKKVPELGLALHTNLQYILG